MSYPLSRLDVSFAIKGCYSLPDEWKVLDDNNPGFFGYNLKFLGKEVNNGKYQPKQLSLSEQRIKYEEDEIAKNKKGGKKGGKGDTVIVV